MRNELIQAVRTQNDPTATEEQKAEAQKKLYHAVRSAGSRQETRLGEHRV